MGLIRVLLAVGVLVGHTGTFFGLNLMDGPTCVQAFFIISGFYMTLILNEKYVNQKNVYWLFISNRLLKLYPAYWAVLIMTISISVAWGYYSENYMLLSPYYSDIVLSISSLVYLIISNIIIIGQDIVMFLGIENGNLFFTPNFNETNPKLYTFLPVGQAWSVSLEILFYIIAPFLLRKRTKIIIIVIFLSISIRLIFNYYSNYDDDPWSYRFFLFELAIFLLGAISYKIYKFLLPYDVKRKGVLLFISTVLFIILFQYIPLVYSTKKWCFLVFLTLAIPFIFLLTKHNKIDTKMGDYSYPIYLTHILAFSIITNIIGTIIPYKIINNIIWNHLGETTLIFSLLFSYILTYFVSKPIEQIRQKRVNVIP